MSGIMYCQRCGGVQWWTGGLGIPQKRPCVCGGVRALTEDMNRAVKLLADVEHGHRNPDDGLQYNHCEEKPCHFCEQARPLIDKYGKQA